MSHIGQPAGPGFLASQDNVILMLSRDGMADVKDDECDGADDTKYLSMIKTFLSVY